MTIQKALKHDFDEAAFHRFLEGRPAEERWQLIDGEPFMMASPTLVHQRIAMNLALKLNEALNLHRPDLFAVHEVGVKLKDREKFRPIPDVAILDAEIEDIRYATAFYLAAEVLSESNSAEFISLKRARYAEAPTCTHVLIIAQSDICLELWSRSNGWRGEVFRSAEDIISLPEFGAALRLGDLYRGTPRA